MQIPDRRITEEDQIAIATANSLEEIESRYSKIPRMSVEEIKQRIQHAESDKAFVFMGSPDYTNVLLPNLDQRCYINCVVQLLRSIPELFDQFTSGRLLLKDLYSHVDLFLYLIRSDIVIIEQDHYNEIYNMVIWQIDDRSDGQSQLQKDASEFLQHLLYSGSPIILEKLHLFMVNYSLLGKPLNCKYNGGWIPIVEKPNELIFQVNPVNYGTSMLLDNLLNHNEYTQEGFASQNSDFKRRLKREQLNQECNALVISGSRMQVHTKMQINSAPQYLLVTLRGIHEVRQFKVSYLKQPIVINHVLYELIACVIHKGRHPKGGGHYVTITKDIKSAEWNLHDDDKDFAPYNNHDFRTKLESEANHETRPYILLLKAQPGMVAAVDVPHPNSPRQHTSSMAPSFGHPFSTGSATTSSMAPSRAENAPTKFKDSETYKYMTESQEKALELLMSDRDPDDSAFFRKFVKMNDMLIELYTKNALQSIEYIRLIKWEIEEYNKERRGKRKQPINLVPTTQDDFRAKQQSITVASMVKPAPTKFKDSETHKYMDKDQEKALELLLSDRDPDDLAFFIEFVKMNDMLINYYGKYDVKNVDKHYKSIHSLTEAHNIKRMKKNKKPIILLPTLWDRFERQKQYESLPSNASSVGTMGASPVRVPPPSNASSVGTLPPQSNASSVGTLPPPSNASSVGTMGASPVLGTSPVPPQSNPSSVGTTGVSAVASAHRHDSPESKETIATPRNIPPFIQPPPIRAAAVAAPVNVSPIGIVAAVNPLGVNLRLTPKP